jgi:hypothetical protein
MGNLLAGGDKAGAAFIVGYKAPIIMPQRKKQKKPLGGKPVNEDCP